MVFFLFDEMNMCNLKTCKCTIDICQETIQLGFSLTCNHPIYYKLNTYLNTIDLLLDKTCIFNKFSHQI